LREGDELIEVKLTDENSHIYMVTKLGMSIHFKETDVRAMGRTAAGVRGMMLQKDDEVVGMQLNTQGPSLLVVSERGYGKRTKLGEFTLQHRGGKGLKCYKITEKTGNVIGVKAVGDEHELMMITNAGTIIQLRMDDINVYSRVTSGVKMINVDEGVTVAKIAKVRADSDFVRDDTAEEAP
ncbi:MAG: DNA gyrase subunit A, partial [Lachnospiraceae bacterium]|nr:DNA gyrase subunit A [Lachnospiraceae bacterium]